MGKVPLTGTGVIVPVVESTLNLVESVYAQIKGESEITGLIGAGDLCRAWPVRAQQGCATPYVVFDILGGSIPHAMNSDTGVEQSNLVVRCYDEDLGHAYALALKVVASFQDFVGNLGLVGVPVQRIFRTSDIITDFDFEAEGDGAFMAMVTFDVWYARA